jgi:trehalose 6-phosphate phosphatase
MKYLFRHLDKIKTRLAHKMFLLFLDYDGTLTPIRGKPRHARLTNCAKNVLNALSKIPRCKLVIISGRSLKDINQMVGLKNIIYGGNHGLELKGPKIRFSSPVSRKHKSTLQKINRQLRSCLRPIKGIIIEDKGLSLSVHYRLVSFENGSLVKTVLRQITAPFLSGNEINIRAGKMVFEILPPVDWDKGKAVLWLLKNTPSRSAVPIIPIYIGDDITDEGAFELLKNSGLTVFVGKPKKSNAKYYVKNVAEVLDFLSWLEKEMSLSKAVG